FALRRYGRQTVTSRERQRQSAASRYRATGNVEARWRAKSHARYGARSASPAGRVDCYRVAIAGKRYVGAGHQRFKPKIHANLCGVKPFTGTEVAGSVSLTTSATC